MESKAGMKENRGDDIFFLKERIGKKDTKALKWI